MKSSRRKFITASSALTLAGIPLVSSAQSNTYSQEINCVSNFDELLNLPPLTNMFVLVKGYSQDGDGGGGLFCYSTTATNSPINNALYDGMLCKSSSGTGVWSRVWDRGKLNLRWFGARPNSASNDSSIAMNRALYYAQSSAVNSPHNGSIGKTIFIPSGRYYFNSAIDDIVTGVNIEGEGNAGSTEQVGTTLFVNYVNEDNEHGFLRYISNSTLNTGGGVRNFTLAVKNLGFKANLITLFSKNQYYVSHWSAEHVRLDCKKSAKRAIFARDFKADGLETAYWRIRDINITNCYMFGANQDRSTLVLSNVANCYLTSCMIYPAGSTKLAGIWISGEDGCNNLTISGGNVANLKVVSALNLLLNARYASLDKTNANLINCEQVITQNI